MRSLCQKKELRLYKWIRLLPYWKNYKKDGKEEGDKLQVYAYKLDNKEKKVYANFFPPEISRSNSFSTKQDMFICFVIVPRDKEDENWGKEFNLYFFSSGYSFTYLFPFVNQEFPIMVAKKFITGEIRNEKTVSITGDTLASDIIFRKMKVLSKYDNVGKVVTGFVGKIDYRNLKKKFLALELEIGEKENIFCDVGNSFELKKSLEFDEILKLIADLNSLYEKWEEESDYDDFQMLKKISPKLDKENLIPKLEWEVIDKLFNDYKKEDANYDFLPSVDLVDPKNFMEFISTTDFKVRYMSKDRELAGWLSMDKIINLIKEDKKSLNREDFEKALESEIFIEWFCNEEATNFSSMWEDLLKLMVAEFDYENKKYFLINGLFYEVKDEFIKVLNQELFLELKKWDIFLPKNLEKKFKKRNKNDDEWVYNRSYLKEKSMLVLDKVFYNKNIEFCDILYYENGQTYLIHNKKWFDRDMRVLSEQILLSAAILSEERKIGLYSKVKDYYMQLKNKEKTKKMRDIGRQEISQEEFVKKFKLDSSINYILGFTYSSDIMSFFKSAKEWASQEDICEKLNSLSIIPRYELLSLIKKMRMLWIKLYITQIPQQ